MSDLVSIGDAARLLGLNASALRYYEERELVQPTSRRAGTRMYGADQLRRLALVQIMHELRIPLDAARAILDEPGEEWRERVTSCVQDLDDLIARATLARDFLGKAMGCKTEHPVAECPKLSGFIDERLAGESFEDLARRHATSRQETRSALDFKPT